MPICQNGKNDERMVRMEKLLLMNGKLYELKVNGIWTTMDGARISLVTDEAVEEIMAQFTPENTAVMKVVDDEGDTVMAITDYTVIGDAVTKIKNATLFEECCEEVVDENGILVEKQHEKVTGTLVEFTMKKQTLKSQIEQNRADIDYILMMQEG